MDNAVHARHHITELLVEFAWRIDHDAGRGVEELFTEQGHYSLFGHRVVGRDAIQQLYEGRRNRGPRVSRHLFTNVSVREGNSPGHWFGGSVLVLHAADGHGISPTQVPTLIDYSDSYRLTPQGTWLFESRETTMVFSPHITGETT